jgi:hypothetical protein
MVQRGVQPQHDGVVNNREPSGSLKEQAMTKFSDLLIGSVYEIDGVRYVKITKTRGWLVPTAPGQMDATHRVPPGTMVELLVAAIPMLTNYRAQEVVGFPG